MTSINRSIRTTVCSALALWAASATWAAPVAGVTATTDMGASSGSLIANTVNGSGLSAIAFNATHDSTVPGNSWASDVGVTTGQVTFDLGGLFLLDGFSFWNQNNGGPGAAGSSGLNRVEVLVSTDGVNYGLWFGDGFAQVPGNGPAAAELFDPADILASHVRFNILSNHGDTQRTGFAEILFDGALVPEPASVALIGLALAGMGSLRRRRT